LCEFCHQHGEGEKWYLKAENYSSDLLSDLRRRNFIRHFFRNPERMRRNMTLLDQLNRLPGFVQAAVKPVLINRQKRNHYGQVLPLEEIEKIFGFVNSVTRLPCICRQASTGSEHRCCYGLSLEPGEDTELGRLVRSSGAEYLTGPDTSGLETISKQEALRHIQELEKKNMFHSVWTFITPFIGGICNCDLDCIAFRALHKSYPAMFRAEYLAEISYDLCIGCRACMNSCQFEAIVYSVKDEKAAIDPLKCYGCGICRAFCREEAIGLRERTAVPVAAELW